MPDTPNAETRSGRWRRFVPLGLIALTAGAFFASGGHRLISFDTLKAQHEAIAAWVSARPFAAAGLFLGGYAAMVACALPVGSVMIVVAGFVFGVAWGTLLAVTAATAGALVLFAAARLAGGDYFERRAAPVVARVREGFQREAVSYMFFLRIVPLFPFFLVTLAVAALGVSTRLFVAATALGIVPVNIAWASVGANLRGMLARGHAPGWADLMTLEFVAPLAALIALSLLPILLHRRRRRRRPGTAR